MHLKQDKGSGHHQDRVSEMDDLRLPFWGLYGSVEEEGWMTCSSGATGLFLYCAYCGEECPANRGTPVLRASL